MRGVLKVPAKLAVMVVAGCAPMMEVPDAARDATARPLADASEPPRIDGGCYSGLAVLGDESPVFSQLSGDRVPRRARVSLERVRPGMRALQHCVPVLSCDRAPG
jgi:hypothetical protein